MKLLKILTAFGFIASKTQSLTTEKFLPESKALNYKESLVDIFSDSKILEHPDILANLSLDKDSFLENLTLINQITNATNPTFDIPTITQEDAKILAQNITLDSSESNQTDIFSDSINSNNLSQPEQIPQDTNSTTLSSNDTIDKIFDFIIYFLFACAMIAFCCQHGNCNNSNSDNSPCCNLC